MKSITICLALTLITISINAQKIIYKSDDFSVYEDRVIQEKDEALAKSFNEITSNYKSSFKTPTKRNLEFKFSINGIDNERDFAQNHYFTINPVNGHAESPLIVFGEPDAQTNMDNTQSAFLQEDADITIRLDMRKVINDFNTKGYYQTFNGQKITKEEFKGVYIAGNIYPLTWDFQSLPDKPEFKLTDANNDGIYEITIHFGKETSPTSDLSATYWKLSKDISNYPKLESPLVLTDALYNKALEEMLLDVRSDSAFMAGAKWPGVWTRDISYSIYLALAAINPDASKVSLRAKVKNKRIIQDTGTGGSWPVSSDRMVWALAAWEVYAVTGDKEWLKESYEVIKNSAEDDLLTARAPETGLFHGESSFLDWREQTYPKWADPVDIYNSQCLGTNAIHFQTYTILSKMAKELNENSDKYEIISAAIKDGINKYLWMHDKGYYGQYLYGRNFQSLSPKSEALGEALSVLFGIASPEQAKTIINNTPVVNFGVPSIYPNIPNVSSYHNNSVWPFVEAFWGLASAKAGNSLSVETALASIYRASALFLTNKENMTASTGDFFGTEINSDRQLWSVAGYLSTVYRILFGMSFEPDGISFAPFIPQNYGGIRILKNFKYRGATLDISTDGFGSEISQIALDGITLETPKIPANLTGKHLVVIVMKNKALEIDKINLAENLYSPETPVVQLSRQALKWDKAENAVQYFIYKNGAKTAETKDNFYPLENEQSFAEYQVLSVDKNNNYSFLSEPVVVNQDGAVFIYQAETGGKRVPGKHSSANTPGFVRIEKGDKNNLTISINVKADGYYCIDFRYANGNGPLNTDNKCAIRTLLVDKKPAGPVVMPHKGNSWTNWGFSSPVKVNLKKGKHTVALTFRQADNNMNGEINSANIDYLRLTLIK